jgi:hypothetical protein
MKISKLILLSALLPLTSYASDITFTNNTNLNSTSIINESFCTNTFGDQGIIKAHSSVTIYQSQLALACGSSTVGCTADIYLSNNCTGPKIGSIMISVDDGVNHVETSSDSYKVSSVDPEHVSIDPA